MSSVAELEAYMRIIAASATGEGTISDLYATMNLGGSAPRLPGTPLPEAVEVAAVRVDPDKVWLTEVPVDDYRPVDPTPEYMQLHASAMAKTQKDPKLARYYAIRDEYQEVRSMSGFHHVMSNNVSVLDSVLYGYSMYPEVLEGLMSRWLLVWSGFELAYVLERIEVRLASGSQPTDPLQGIERNRTYEYGLFGVYRQVILSIAPSGAFTDPSIALLSENMRKGVGPTRVADLPEGTVIGYSGVTAKYVYHPDFPAEVIRPLHDMPTMVGSVQCLLPDAVLRSPEYPIGWTVIAGTGRASEHAYPATLTRAIEVPLVFTDPDTKQIVARIMTTLGPLGHTATSVIGIYHSSKRGDKPPEAVGKSTRMILPGEVPGTYALQYQLYVILVGENQTRDSGTPLPVRHNYLVALAGHEAFLEIALTENAFSATLELATYRWEITVAHLHRAWMKLEQALVKAGDREYANAVLAELSMTYETAKIIIEGADTGDAIIPPDPYYGYPILGYRKDTSNFAKMQLYHDLKVRMSLPNDFETDTGEIIDEEHPEFDTYLGKYLMLRAALTLYGGIEPDQNLANFLNSSVELTHLIAHKLFDVIVGGSSLEDPEDWRNRTQARVETKATNLVMIEYMSMLRNIALTIPGQQKHNADEWNDLPTALARFRSGSFLRYKLGNITRASTRTGGVQVKITDAMGSGKWSSVRSADERSMATALGSAKSSADIYARAVTLVAGFEPASTDMKARVDHTTELPFVDLAGTPAATSHGGRTRYQANLTHTSVWRKVSDIRVTIIENPPDFVTYSQVPTGIYTVAVMINFKSVIWSPVPDRESQAEVSYRIGARLRWLKLHNIIPFDVEVYRIGLDWNIQATSGRLMVPCLTTKQYAVADRAYWATSDIEVVMDQVTGYPVYVDPVTLPSYIPATSGAVGTRVPRAYEYIIEHLYRDDDPRSQQERIATFPWEEMVGLGYVMWVGTLEMQDYSVGDDWSGMYSMDRAVLGSPAQAFSPATNTANLYEGNQAPRTVYRATTYKGNVQSPTQIMQALSTNSMFGANAFKEITVSPGHVTMGVSSNGGTYYCWSSLGNLGGRQVEDCGTYSAHYLQSGAGATFLVKTHVTALEKGQFFSHDDAYGEARIEDRDNYREENPHMQEYPGGVLAAAIGTMTMQDLPLVAVLSRADATYGSSSYRTPHYTDGQIIAINIMHDARGAPTSVVTQIGIVRRCTDGNKFTTKEAQKHEVGPVHPDALMPHVDGIPVDGIQGASGAPSRNTHARANRQVQLEIAANRGERNWVDGMMPLRNMNDPEMQLALAEIQVHMVRLMKDANGVPMGYSGFGPQQLDASGQHVLNKFQSQGTRGDVDPSSGNPRKGRSGGSTRFAMGGQEIAVFPKTASDLNEFIDAIHHPKSTNIQWYPICLKDDCGGIGFAAEVSRPTRGYRIRCSKCNAYTSYDANYTPIDGSTDGASFRRVKLRQSFIQERRYAESIGIEYVLKIAEHTSKILPFSALRAKYFAI